LLSADFWALVLSFICVCVVGFFLVRLLLIIDDASG
jgi:hypothetical protein